MRSCAGPWNETSLTLGAAFGCIILCTMQKKIVSAHLCMGSVQGAVHIVAVRLGCKGAMVGTSRGNAHPGCMNGLALSL